MNYFTYQTFPPDIPYFYVRTAIAGILVCISNHYRAYSQTYPDMHCMNVCTFQPLYKLERSQNSNTRVDNFRYIHSGRNIFCLRFFPILSDLVNNIRNIMLKAILPYVNTWPTVHGIIYYFTLFSVTYPLKNLAHKRSASWATDSMLIVSENNEKK